MSLWYVCTVSPMYVGKVLGIPDQDLFVCHSIKIIVAEVGHRDG